MAKPDQRVDADGCALPIVSFSERPVIRSGRRPVTRVRSSITPAPPRAVNSAHPSAAHGVRAGSRRAADRPVPSSRAVVLQPLDPDADLLPADSLGVDVRRGGVRGR